METTQYPLIFHKYLYYKITSQITCAALQGALTKEIVTNTYRRENFSFLVGYLSYLTIHVIVAIPTASVYLENMISYIGIKVHLLSLENIFFQSKLIFNSYTLF